MNVLLSYLLVLFIYSFFINRIIILNRSFNELFIRLLSTFFGISGLFLQRKSELYAINNMFVFYVVIILAIFFVLLLAFVGNKIDYNKILKINLYDIITSILSLFILSFCFLYYAGFDIYPFSSNFLFINNILFCLWLMALWGVTILPSNKESKGV